MATLKKKFIGANQVDGSKIRLDNDETLRARNAADSADVDILKVDSSDKIVFSSVPQVAADPVAGNDLVRKSYLDARLEGLDPKEAVRVVATSNVSIATGLEDGDTIDGVTLATGDRVLLIGQTDAKENGVYVVVASGAASRSSDMNASAEFPGAYTLVRAGTAGTGQGYVCTVPDSFTLGVDNVTFVLFKAAADFIGGDGIDITGQTISVDLSVASGLEFSTGELQIKLEASNPSLQISGGELGAKLDAAGAIVKGSGGLSVQVDGSSVAIATNSLKALKPKKQTITLSGGDITNQYIDLAFAAFGASASDNSISLTPVGGPQQEKTVDYTVSLTGGSGGVTRITFAGDLATGGDAALVAGDKLIIEYDYL